MGSSDASTREAERLAVVGRRGHNAHPAAGMNARDSDERLLRRYALRVVGGAGHVLTPIQCPQAAPVSVGLRKPVGLPEELSQPAGAMKAPSVSIDMTPERRRRMRRSEQSLSNCVEVCS